MWRDPFLANGMHAITLSGRSFLYFFENGIGFFHATPKAQNGSFHILATSAG